MSSTICPSDQALRQYAIGDCGDDVVETIERHLAECPSCEETIALFDSADDTLMRHLPLAAADRVSPPGEAPNWLDRLRNGVPTPAAGESPLFTEKPSITPAEGLANYELLGVIGQGGMGVVYLARHKQLNRRVALKVLSPRTMASAEAHRRFQREIHLLGSLNHPGIVMATDAGAVASGAYLVMELIDGADLARIVREGGPLSVAEACEVGRQMAEALAAAHELGAIHRDVKPSNVMIDRQRGRVRLLDFGLARLGTLSQESGETSVGRLLGTLDYMAPEQTEGDQAVDPRADLYGLGATLFCLLTGRPPHGSHAGRSLLEHLRSITQDEPPRVGSLRVGILQELDDFIAKLLSSDPAQRPASAAAVAAELSKWAGGDLAARVADLPPRPSTADQGTQSVVEAQQSLSRLLGLDSISATRVDSSRNREEQTSTTRTRGRMWPRLAAAGVLLVAVLCGVIILLKTPEGTLRIESEVDNVQVQLVDENDRSQELRIEPGTNEKETKLRVGRYRITLTGAHDGLSLDKETITLLRGKETVARITRISAEQPELAPPAAMVESASTTSERLYLGRTEAEWQRLFEAETEPTAKLNAAAALLALAAQLPAEKQLERILEIGGAVIEAGYGDRAIEFGFEMSTPSQSVPLWRTSPTDNLGGGGGGVVSPNNFRSAMQSFLNLVAYRTNQLSPASVAKRLSEEIISGSDARAACACWLLGPWTYSVTPFESNPAAREIVYERLTVPLTGLDRSAVCLLMRCLNLSSAAPDEEQRKLGSDLNKLLDQLISRPRTESQKQFFQFFRSVVSSRPQLTRLPIDTRKAAQLVLEECLVENRQEFSHDLWSWGRQLFESQSTYNSGGFFGGQNAVSRFAQPVILNARNRTSWFLSDWMAVANPYLAEQPEANRGPEFWRIVSYLTHSLRWYSDGDNWPMEETAKWGTETLRKFYLENPDDPEKQIRSDRFPMIPGNLLTMVTLSTCEIPDFIREEHPNRWTPQKLRDLQTVLNAPQGSQAALKQIVSECKYLLNSAPYETIQAVLDVQEPGLKKLFALWNWATPIEFVNETENRRYVVAFLYALTAGAVEQHNGSKELIDPMLLLVILADFTGETEEQDARIAKFFDTDAPALLLRQPLEDILSGKLKIREHVHRKLREMAAKSKSQYLIDQIKQLDPSAVPAVQGSTGKP